MSGKSEGVLVACTFLCVFCVIVCCGFYIRLEFRVQRLQWSIQQRDDETKEKAGADYVGLERKVLQISPLARSRNRRLNVGMENWTKADLIKEVAQTFYTELGRYCSKESRPCLNGSQGPAGPKGAAGPKGRAGLPGTPGLKGQKGDKCGDCSEAPAGKDRPDLSGKPIRSTGIFLSPSTLIKGENETARFTCNGGGGSDRAKVSWTRLGGKALPVGRTIAGEDGILRISRLRVEDSGEYQCSVASDSRVARAKVKLTVHAPPRISLDPGPTYVSAGENVTLPECHVTGFPRPVVTWAKVLDKLPVGRLVVGSQTLSILEARKADSGSYICKATSTAGSSRQATQIVVTVVPKFTLTPPPITEKFAGSSVTLQCQATGNPLPRISWENACSGALPRVHETSSNGSLTIHRLQSTDSGRYVCKATSGLLQERTTSQLRVKIARDCSELYSAGMMSNGVYTVDPDGHGPFEVFCDMVTDGGGWTVFQRRLDGAVSFFRTWDDYKTGFGDLNHEFWLGNEKIYRLTKNASELRVDLEDWAGNTHFAKYGQFRLGDESTKYALVAAAFSGTAKDKLKYHNGKSFSTRDNDNDDKSSRSCAREHMGAWWFSSCLDSHLNGEYVNNKDENRKRPDRMTWDYWDETSAPLKATDMKVRRKRD